MKKTTIIVLCMLLISVGILAACNKGPQPADRLSQYIKLWNEQKFAEMYDYLSVELLHLNLTFLTKI